MKKLLIILLAIFLAISFAACSEEAPQDAPDPIVPSDEPEEEEESPQTKCVRIDYSMYGDDDELVVKFVEAEIGSLLAEPEKLSNPHYTFGGWYKSEDETPWNFDTDTVDENTDIYAKWIPIDYTATFVGPFYIDPYTYNIDESSVPLPEDVYEHWDIEGFYADEKCTEKLSKLPEPQEVFDDYTVYFKASYIPFKYTVKKLNDGIEGNEEVEITGLYDTSYTDITIPATIKGMPVVKFSFNNCPNKQLIKKVTVSGGLCAVSEYAFSGLSVEEVIIEDGVGTIEGHAFESCASLAKLTVAESVTKIGHSAFAECSSLTKLVIPGKLTSVASDAFSGCDKLVSAVFENSEIIGGFSHCNKLETVEVGSALHTVEDSAFFGCESLKQIKLVGGASAKDVYLKTVGSYAFSSCPSLESVGSLEKLETVGNNAFSNCASFMKDKVLDISKLDRISERAFCGCPIKNITFSDTIVSIGEKAFYECDSLDGFIYIPESLDSIGDNVFKKNDNIKIFINYSGDKALVECWWYENFENGNWHDGVKRVYVGAYFKTFENDDGKYVYTSRGNNLAYISIVDFEPRESDGTIVVNVPKKIGDREIKRIDKYAFEDCDNVARIILPKSISDIYEYAFYGCDELLRVHIPTIVQEIGDYAFADCRKLEFAYIASAEIGACVFKNTAVKTVYFYGNDRNEGFSEDWSSGSSVSETVYAVYLTDSGLLWKKDENPQTCLQGAVIVGQTYNSEHKLPPLADIPEKLRPLNENTDYTVFRIDYGAFTENSFVDYVSIPDTVIEIASNAFYNCKLLQCKEYGNALYVGSSENPYMFCVKAKSTDIETVELHPDTRFIGANAFSGCASLTELLLPDGLKCIGGSAFKDCVAIREITVPDSVQSIERYAFYQCFGIRELNIGAVEEIGAYAFYECGTMELTLGEGIINIAEFAFYGSNLHKIVIPDSVKRIGAYAFFRVGHIDGQGITHDITIGSGIEYLGRYALCSNGSGCLLGGYEDEYAYYLGNERNNYLVLVALKDTSVTSFALHSETKVIYTDAFAGCASLRSITLSGIVSIGSYAFSDCTSLESVTLGSGLLYIGEGAFNGCTALSSLRIPESVKEIETIAFKDCTNLISLYVTSAVREMGYNICEGCDRVTIYSTAKEKPSYWDYDWNTYGCKVVWGYQN